MSSSLKDSDLASVTSDTSLLKDKASSKESEKDTFFGRLTGSSKSTKPAASEKTDPVEKIHKAYPNMTVNSRLS